MVRQQRGQIAGQSRRPGPASGSRQFRRTGGRSRRPGPRRRSPQCPGRRLVGGIGKPHAHAVRAGPVPRLMPTSSSSSRAAVCAAVSPGSGLPPGCMNLSGAALPDGQEPPGRIEDADGGDHDVRVHPGQPFGRCRLTAQHGFQQQVLGRPGDIPGCSWNSSGPIERVAHAVGIRVAPVPVLAGSGPRSSSGGTAGRRGRTCPWLSACPRAAADTHGWQGR